MEAFPSTAAHPHDKFTFEWEINSGVRCVWCEKLQPSHHF